MHLTYTTTTWTWIGTLFRSEPRPIGDEKYFHIHFSVNKPDFFFNLCFCTFRCSLTCSSALPRQISQNYIEGQQKGKGRRGKERESEGEREGDRQKKERLKLNHIRWSNQFMLKYTFGIWTCTNFLGTF